MSARTTFTGIGRVRGLMHRLRDGMRRRWRAQAAVARERLYDYERGARERYFAAAPDAADLERRQRGWERAEPHAWP